MMRFVKTFFLLLLVLMACEGCQKQVMPKPYAYYRIDLPDPSYVKTSFENEFLFDMSTYAKLNPTTEKVKNYDIWKNIDYPQWNARIHLSFKHITPADLYELTEESRSLAYKHTIRADAIDEHYYENPETKTYAVFYSMSGNAASQAQFYITDSTSHFLRGALYFNNIPNFDSIAPVSQFIENDMIRLIETVEWK